jgi:hypothetical protein
MRHDGAQLSMKSMAVGFASLFPLLPPWKLEQLDQAMAHT